MSRPSGRPGTPIKRTCACGCTVQRWPSMKAATKELNYYETTISQRVRRGSIADGWIYEIDEEGEE